jgi:hypothetical protein
MAGTVMRLISSTSPAARNEPLIPPPPSSSNRRTKDVEHRWQVDLWSVGDDTVACQFGKVAARHVAAEEDHKMVAVHIGAAEMQFAAGI